LLLLLSEVERQQLPWVMKKEVDRCAISTLQSKLPT